MSAIPAGDQRQAVSCEQRPQRAGIAGEFVAELNPGKTGLPCLVETGFERDVAAEFGQIVVAPADRADPEANRHRRAPSRAPGQLLTTKPAAALLPRQTRRCYGRAGAYW